MFFPSGEIARAILDSEWQSKRFTFFPVAVLQRKNSPLVFPKTAYSPFDDIAAD